MLIVFVVVTVELQLIGKAVNPAHANDNELKGPQTA